MNTAPSRDQLARTLTVYGRKPVLEALNDVQLAATTLHVADSNKAAGIISNILRLAEQRGIPVRKHDRDSLSRISKNRKQDQGVALDITCPNFGDVNELCPSASDATCRLLALDGVTNPQNVGMIIRSAVAGGINGILYPRRGVAALGPLVIKASAGTVFRAPLYHCDTLMSSLQTLKAVGFSIASLEGQAKLPLFNHQPKAATIYVLGSETEGVSGAISRLADTRLKIPMANGVESLNVAVAAALIAYGSQLH